MEKTEKHILNAYRINRSERDGDTLKIEGYACHFGTVNGNGEVVNKESFDFFLGELKKDGLMPIFNFNHNPDRIIGGWDSIEADEKGLYAKGHLNTGVAFVRDELLPLIEAGDLSHLSTEGWANGHWSEELNAFVCDEFLLCGIALVALPADFKAKADIHNHMNVKVAQQPQHHKFKKLFN